MFVTLYNQSVILLTFLRLRIIMTVCEQCNNELIGKQIYCSAACRQAACRARLSKDYTAENIEIKEYAIDTWAAAVSLANEYDRSAEWIQRSLEACRLVRVDYSYFIDRYLKKIDTPINKDVNAISWELQKELRWKK